MKFLVMCILVALAVAVKSDGELLKMMQDCKTKVGATEEDVGKFMISAPPSNQEQKCLYSCVMDFMGMIKAGKLQKEAVIEFTKKVTSGTPEKLQQAEEVFAECNVIKGDDECDAAAKIAMCLKTSGDKRQILFGV